MANVWVFLSLRPAGSAGPKSASKHPHIRHER